MTDAELAYLRDTAAGEMRAEIRDLKNQVGDLDKKVDKMVIQLSTYNGAQKALLWLAGAFLAIGGWVAHSWSSGKP